MPMSEEDRLLVHAYLDGELDVADALALEKRIAGDEALVAERDRVMALQNVLHTRIEPERPSPALRGRIETAVGLRRRPRPRSLLAMAASIMLAAALGSAATFLVVGARDEDSLTDIVVSDHIRALMAPQSVDVASSDKHTVKPWFNGRIPEAPRVVDLAKEDFPLIGGRLDVVRRQPVATLVYRHRKHIISLTAVATPSKPNTTPQKRTDDGYNLITWTEGGVTYLAVSDVSDADLAHFAELFRTAPADQ
jgi:anti-sigma factor RsiW